MSSLTKAVSVTGMDYIATPDCHVPLAPKYEDFAEKIEAAAAPAFAYSSTTVMKPPTLELTRIQKPAETVKISNIAAPILVVPRLDKSLDHLERLRRFQLFLSQNPLIYQEKALYYLIRIKNECSQ